MTSGRPSDLRRVLVVDDEEPIRSFVQRVLTQDGYNVITACDGPDALRCVEAHPLFDLYVVDLMMPQMTGDEFARRLRKREPDARILYFTAHSDRLFARRQVLWEHEAFIDKPISRKGLLEAVSQLLFGRAQSLGTTV